MLIYKLTFKDSSIYIGKTTKTVEERLTSHLSKLRLGKHHSYKMQKAYNNYGVPIVEVIDTATNISELDTKEIFWIKELDSFRNGLNCSPGGELVGQGEFGISNKYTNDDYYAVVHFLAYTDMSLVEISNETGVGYAAIKHLYAGRTNSHLINEIPEAYAAMIRKKLDKTNKVWKVIDSSGVAHSFSVVKDFITKHKLNSGRFNMLLNNKILKYKGWTLA